MTTIVRPTPWINEAVDSRPIRAALRDLLASAELGRRIEGQEADWLSEALRRHPSAAEKIGSGIAGFTVLIVPEFGSRSFHVLRTDGTRAPFSIGKCFPPRPRRPVQPPRPLSDGDLTKAICDALSENEPKVRRHVRALIRVMGRPKVARLLREMQQIERAGGMLTLDGSRRRTKGGVFLLLAKEHATEDEARRLWPWRFPQEPVD